ncbi:FecR domain-containing protein [Danxiaibacter flavus]|uniref:FecR domain-containing protein n=1 Tax=Danxiaibacter flavus TaxID=3049108 RepID=A0ABV3ZMV1_9BACT|nr:FecR domain-containing protein [Chitinophagaceae bacterium DXS]
MKHFSNDMIDDLLVKYLAGEITPDEEQVLNQWINEGAENRKYYNDFRLIWEKSLDLAAKSTMDEHEAWKRFQQRINQKPGAAIVELPRKKTKRNTWLKIAAAMFFVIAGSAITYLYIFKPKPVETLQIATVNEVINDTLPDASVVTLNKHSKLYYPSRFNKDNRSVTLEGEAFFNITPNKQSPFLITVNDITVKVVGTSFNIRSFNGKTEVIVETGVVQVIKNGKITELRPKEKIVTDAQDSSFTKQPLTDELYNYYRSKKFICDNTSLERLVEMLNEAYGVHIIIAKDELKKLSLTTTFDNETLDHIIEIISDTFNISVVHKDGQIILE